MGTLEVNAGFGSGPPSSGTAFDNIDNTIVGAFSVTSNMENDGAGVMDATATSFITGEVVNNGLIEATAGGGLGVVNLDQSGGGTLLADGVNVTIGLNPTYTFGYHGYQVGWDHQGRHADRGSRRGFSGPWRDFDFRRNRRRRPYDLRGDHVRDTPTTRSFSWPGPVRPRKSSTTARST